MLKDQWNIGFSVHDPFKAGLKKAVLYSWCFGYYGNNKHLFVFYHHVYRAQAYVPLQFFVILKSFFFAWI